MAINTSSINCLNCQLNDHCPIQMAMHDTKVWLDYHGQAKRFNLFTNKPNEVALLYGEEFACSEHRLNPEDNYELQ